MFLAYTLFVVHSKVSFHVSHIVYKMYSIYIVRVSEGEKPSYLSRAKKNVVLKCFFYYYMICLAQAELWYLNRGQYIFNHFLPVLIREIPNCPLFEVSCL